MSIVATDNKHYSDIADKIREKTGTDATYKPSEMPSGIDAVYTAGQKSMVDQNKLIPKTVSGSYISVDDVSEVPHSVACKVESVNLLFNKQGDLSQENIYKKVEWSVNEDGTINVVGSCTSADNADYYFFGMNGDNDDAFVAEEPLTVSTNAGGSGILCALRTDKGYEQLSTANNYTKTIPVGTKVYGIFLRLYNNTVDVSNIYVMLNRGTTALPYTPHIKPETVKVTRTGTNLCGGEAFAEKLLSSGATSTIDRANRTVTLRDDSNAKTFIWWSDFEPNTRYTIFLKGKNSTTSYPNSTNLMCWYTDGRSTKLEFDEENSMARWTSPAGKTIDRICGSWNAGLATFEYDYVGLFKDVLTLEDFESYNGQTLTPNTDGTVEGITSVSPHMNIFTDTVGANIEATYNKSWGMQEERERFYNAFRQGVINHSISFEWLTLSKESIAGIINALSTTATGQTVTFKKSAKEAAFTDDEWEEITATKPNWTFSLL